MKTFKTFLFLVGCFSVALAGVVNAEDQDQGKEKNAKSKPKVTQPPRHVAPPQNVSQAPPVNRNPAPSNQSKPKPQYPASAYNPTTRNTQYPASAYNPTTRNAFLPAPTPIVRTDPRNDDRTRHHNWHDNDGNHKHNWRNRPQYESWAEVCRRHPREHHDRYWWKSHYNRFALFGAGYFFWDAGYWYPAYGYDPGYNTYEYEQPIYAYNDLNPSEVISNVQTELQQLGYYPYEVDGLMGPETRTAISNYQRDNGLDITSAIDQPTLESLGLGSD